MPLHQQNTRQNLNGLQLQSDGQGGFVLPSDARTEAEPPTPSSALPPVTSFDQNRSLEGLQLQSDGQGGFILPDNLAQRFTEVPSGEDPTKGLGFFDSIGESVTGNLRTTEEIESIPELGVLTPELRSLDSNALQTMAGLATTGDTDRLRRILQQQFPDARLRKDAKGNDIVDFPSGSYALNKPGFSGGDLARGFIDVAAFAIPGLGAARIAGSAVRGAGALAIGANAGGSVGVDLALQNVNRAVGGGPVDVGQTAIAGLTGGAGQLVSNVANKVVRGVGGDISPAHQEIVEAGQREGVQVASTDLVTGVVPTFVDRIGRNVLVAGTGGNRQTQREARVEAIQQLSDRTPDVTADEVFTWLREGANKRKRDAGAQLGRIRFQLDTQGDVPLNTINRQIQRSLDQLNGVRGQRDNFTIGLIEELQTALRPRHNGRGFNFSELSDQLTTTRERFGSIDPAVRSQLSSRGKRQANLIQEQMQLQLQDFVLLRNGASTPRRQIRFADLYRRANDIYRRQAIRLSQTRLRRTLDVGEVEPDRVIDLLRNSNESESRNLFRILRPIGIDHVRSALVQDVIKRSVADGAINPKLFSKEMSKVIRVHKIFFNSQEMKRVKGLTKLIQATKKSVDEDVISRGIDNVAVTAGLLLTKLPLAGTVGLAARIYESKPVRNFLLRAADTPRNELLTSRVLNRLAVPALSSLQALERGNSQ